MSTVSSAASLIPRRMVLKPRSSVVAAAARAGANARRAALQRAVAPRREPARLLCIRADTMAATTGNY